MRNFYLQICLCGFQFMQIMSSGLREWSPWTKSGECTATCGQGYKYETRYCKVVRKDKSPSPSSDKSPSANSCKGLRHRATPCFKYACPEDEKTVCNCGCTLTNGKGEIVSRVNDKVIAQCTWTIIGKSNSKVRIRIDRFRSGTLYTSTETSRDRELINYSKQPIDFPITYTSSANLLNVTIYYHEASHGKGGVEMDAFYEEVPNDDMYTADSSPGSVAVIAISVCGAIIVIAVIGILYQRCLRENGDKRAVEEADDNFSSTSSNRSSKTKRSAPTVNEDQSISLLGSEKRLSIERGDNPLLMRGFPDGREVFIPATPKSQESYGSHQLMWPTHMESDERGMRQAILQPNIGMMIKQGQIPFTPQGTIVLPPQVCTLEKKTGSEKGYYPNNACDG